MSLVNFFGIVCLSDMVWLHLLFFDCHLLHFEPRFVFRAEVSLLEAAYSWVLFFFPLFIQSLCVFWLLNSTNFYLEWLLLSSTQNCHVNFCFWLIYISVVSFSLCFYLLFKFGGFLWCFSQLPLSCFVLYFRFVYGSYHKVYTKTLLK